MASCTFGWDLLYNSVKDDIKNDKEVLVCLAHFVLVTNDFKCIGLGESKELDGEEKKSESLPKKWNEHYAIRYVRQGRLYNLQATLLDDKVLINLHRIDEGSVGLVQLNADSVAGQTGTIDEMIPDHKRLIDVIKCQLVDKLVVSEKSKDCSSQTDEPERRFGPPPSRLIEPMPAGGFEPMPAGGFAPSFGYDPLRVGQADLHPLGGPLAIGPMPGGGGMLFRPPGGSSSFPNGGHPGGVARGSVPPGARFDPFRPPGGPPLPRRRFPPDSDEFPPPDFDHYS